MAFGAVQQFPNDLRPRIGIGVNLPFSEGNGFTPNYTTAESIRYNLINYFLTIQFNKLFFNKPRRKTR